MESAVRLQVLLDETRTEVDVELYQRRIADRLETVDLAGLDHKDIAGAALEGLAVDSPHSPAFTNELDLVIRMAMRPGTRTRLAMEQED